MVLCTAIYVPRIHEMDFWGVRNKKAASPEREAALEVFKLRQELTGYPAVL